MTPAQFLAWEREADYWHEYDNGIITDRARSNRRHGLIRGNLAATLGDGLEGRPGQVHAFNLRVWVEPSGLIAYPDVLVVHDEPRCLDSEDDTLLNPTVIAEVYSPQTEDRDRGRKFAHYRRLESLREYVLVAQDRVSVERFTRRGDEWVLSAWGRIEDVLMLESIGVEMPLKEIYAKVRFDDAGSPAGG